MIRTSDLIKALVADAQPMRHLRPPVQRAALWLLLAALIFGLLALGHGVRSDLAQRLGQPDFIAGTAASLLTGALAALASFMLNLPDRSRGWALLPVPALLIWIATLGHGCLVNWVNIGPDGVQLGETARCFGTVLMISLPLSLAMFAMLRRGSLLSASTVALTGSLAVGALSATAMSLFHNLDATVMILVWNLGTVAFIVAVGRWLGHR
jgi:hypothetical protein